MSVRQADSLVMLEREGESLPADEEISIHPAAKCDCGGEIVLEEKPYRHQKLELPVIKPRVTNYYLYHPDLRTF